MDHGDLEDSILKRRFAPMPRRRAVLTEEAVEAAVKALSGIAANELAKTAEELLEHFESHEEHEEKQGLVGGEGKANRMTSRAQETGSDSSVVGEVKVSGLITPDSSSKNTLSEDGNITVSLTDTYAREWTTASGPRARSSSAGSSARTHDCEADGCYGLTARFIDDDRLSDDYAARGGGKKRKVPASAQQGPTQSGEREESGCGHTCGHVCDATTSSIVDRMHRASTEDTADPPSQEYPHARCCSHSSIRIVPDPVIHIPKRRSTPARTAQEFEKRLFLGRKAQVMGLWSDAVTCLSQEQRKPSKTAAPGQGKTPVEGIPTKDELEELVQALEYIGVSGWEGDRVGAGAGAGAWDGHVLRGRIKGTTLTATTATTSGADPEPKVSPGKLKWRKRGRVAERYSWLSREPVKRGGWIPEGTFEFEMPSSVSSTMQKSAHDLNALRAKVTQLLTLTLSSPSMTSFLNDKPNPMVPLPVKGDAANGPKTSVKDTAPTTKRDRPADGHHPSELQNTSAPSSTAPVPADVKDDPEQKPRKAHQNSHNVTVEPSADDPDYVPPPFANAAGAKKGKKKKKKSAMANAANPHHVKNYVPSRRPVNPPQADMPNLVDFLSMLFFPPPTRFLNSKPRRSEDETQGKSTRRREPVRASADATDEEYVCCFCEYDLFFGSEQAMDKAVRRRKKVLERRQKAQEKAAGLIAGRGLRSKPARGDGDPDDDERCAGGEQCRCAEIRAQEGQSRDADSRGIEDTYSDEGRESDVEEYKEETNDPPRVLEEQTMPSDVPIRAAGLGTSDPPRAVLPEVETFDLDEQDPR